MWLCVCKKQNKTKHSEGIPVSYYIWLYRLHISQAPFLCHYSLRFAVREANRPFSKTNKMFVKKISGTFHAFSQFARKCGGRPVSPHYLAIAHFLTICEKVCGRPTHFLANCEKVRDCEKAWADNPQKTSPPWIGANFWSSCLTILCKRSLTKPATLSISQLVWSHCWPFLYARL
jgi:hypothetical protein